MRAAPVRRIAVSPDVGHLLALVSAGATVMPCARIGRRGHHPHLPTINPSKRAAITIADIAPSHAAIGVGFDFSAGVAQTHKQKTAKAIVSVPMFA